METSNEKIKNLYIAINNVVAEIGKEGQIDSRHKLTEELMHALFDIDGGEYKPKLLDQAQTDAEPVDLDLARAMCRSAGISLVSRDFIERFADFVMDWKKGDFTLPKYAEIDMQSCFDAWQAFNPDIATHPPKQAKAVSAEDVTETMVDKVEELAGMGHGAWDMVYPKEIIAAAVNAFNGVKP